MQGQDDGSGRNKGRPPIEDSEQIVALFIAQLPLGKTVSAIAAEGLTILEYGGASAEPPKLGEACRPLKEKTLERRFRQHLKAEIAEFERMSAALRREGARCIGISMPMLPFSLSHGQSLKRGRPKKKRGH
jgi:hypothetical protein